MKTLKHIFQLNLSPKEAVWSKRILAIAMLPIFMFYMTSMNFLVMGMMRASAEDVITEVAPPEEPVEEPAAPAEEPVPVVEEPTPVVEPAPAVVEPTPIVEVVTPVITPANETQNNAVPTETAAGGGGGPVVETPIEGVITPEAASTEAVVADPIAEVVPVETVTVTEEVPVVAPEWQVSEDGKIETIGPVELGKTYVAPQNSEVTVTFTEINGEPGTLSIEEITLTPEQVKTLGALSNKAYDITSDMTDKTFKYNLTLPKVENNISGISYIEKTADELDGVKSEEVKKIDENKIDVKSNTIEATGIDHFTIFVVTNLDPSWDAVGGGGVYSAYTGPLITDTAVAPGITAIYDGREAGIIKAGLAADPIDGIYWDQGIFAFKPTVTINTFAGGTLTYDVDKQFGENPVWMTIEIDTGVTGEANRSDNTVFQFVPTTNPTGWHSVDAGAGLWQKWNNNDGDVTGNIPISLSAIAANPLYTGLNVVRAYLRLGMGDAYNNGGTGTIAWVDQATLGGNTYDFKVAASTPTQIPANRLPMLGTLTGVTLTPTLGKVTILNGLPATVSSVSNPALFTELEAQVPGLGSDANSRYVGFMINPPVIAGYEWKSDSLKETTSGFEHDYGSEDRGGSGTHDDGTELWQAVTIKSGDVYNRTSRTPKDYEITWILQKTGSLESKAVTELFTVEQTLAAPTLTIYKVCLPSSNGLERFNFQIDALNVASDAMCGGSTGPVVVSVGSHTVGETAGTGTNLSNYTSVISGACDAGGNVTLAAGENKTCTITNTLDTTLPTVTVTMDDAALNIGDTSLVTFTFSEAPVGFDATDVDLTNANGAIGSIDTSNPLIQTATFTPANGVTDTTNIIVVGTSWTDAALNVGVGDSSDNYTVDTLAPSAFDVGLVTASGGTLSPGYWNSTNTGGDVVVPIANDSSLVGGTVQLQAEADGTFVNVMSAFPITLDSLDTSISYAIFAANLEGIPGFTDGATVHFRAIITDSASNPTIGTPSATALTVDQTRPTGTISINSGAIRTAITGVMLSISASPDLSGVTEMNIANASSYAGWEPYAITKAWTLVGADGEKTVRVKFRDAAGNETATGIPDTIILDTIAPVAVNDSATTAEDTQIIINVTGNDIDASSLVVSGGTQGANGSVTFGGSNATYTPNLNFVGSDTFTYQVFDGALSSNFATVTVTVTPVGDGPLAVGDTATTPEDTAVTTLVLANDTDVDGDILSVTGVTQGTNGLITFTGTDTTYTPNANFNGSDSYTYAISDGNGGIDGATVNVTVTAVNDAPVITAPADITMEATGLLTPVTLGSPIVSDVDSPAPVVTDDAPASFPVGVTIVTWTATDTASASTSATQTVTILDTTPPTDPVATPVAGNYDTDQSVTLESTDSVSDPVAIYYTLDGTTPDNSKTLYTGAITVDHDMTIKAIAYDNVGNPSVVLEAAYGIAPVISGEVSSSVSETAVTINWTTDDLSTSRVIYGTDPVSDATVAIFPDGSNYGYANSTIEDSTRVTSHSVGLTGLTAGTAYYYRTVSHGSPETVSAEQTFTTTDTTNPVVTLNGEENVSFRRGRDYNEQGATWTDNDGSGNVTTITGTVDNNKRGVYYLTYSYTDTSGNTGSAIRKVTVMKANNGGGGGGGGGGTAGGGAAAGVSTATVAGGTALGVETVTEEQPTVTEELQGGEVSNQGGETVNWGTEENNAKPEVLGEDVQKDNWSIWGQWWFWMILLGVFSLPTWLFFRNRPTE